MTTNLETIRACYEYQRRMAVQLFDQLHPDTPMTFRPPPLETPPTMNQYLTNLIKKCSELRIDQEVEIHESKIKNAALVEALNQVEKNLNEALLENDKLKRALEPCRCARATD